MIMIIHMYINMNMIIIYIYIINRNILLFKFQNVEINDYLNKDIYFHKINKSIIKIVLFVLKSKIDERLQILHKWST